MVLGVVVLAGCGFDPPTVRLVCSTADECGSGTCVSGFCEAVVDTGFVDVDSDTLADGGVDMSADAPDASDCFIDNDNDGFFVGIGCALEVLDCDDAKRTVFPGAAQQCNGLDNDCDGLIDSADCACIDMESESCGNDAGACVAGTRTCAGGEWGACMGAQGPNPEICDGIDNDCDGVIDQGCPCAPDESRNCGSDVGECAFGTQSCVEGSWGDCMGAIGPSNEVCDGFDNDCNGVPDNNPVGAGDACATGRPGRCSTGVQVCQNATLSCQAVNGPVAETCNNVDDNCNGSLDENVTRSCTSACGAGTQTCSAGAFDACAATNPPVEICDGLDNDCDGDTDETFPEQATTCETGLLGACGVGAYQCTPEGLRCVTTQAASAEACDGIDNDCDGLVDENTSGLVLSEQCGGTCPTRSVRVCTGGVWSACDHDEVEVCNQADSNCDGLIDNMNVCYRACPGGGVATGTLNCQSGTCALPPEICGDGLDNDCDGQVDQNCTASLNEMAYVPGGTFIMGSLSTDPYADVDEQPRHLVSLSPYYIDRFEVTRGEYTQCFLNGKCSALPLSCPFQNLASSNRPVLCVSWAQADDYCDWKGGMLPTEAEWEKAARGPFSRTTVWPWGNQEDATKGVFNCTSSNGANCVQDVTSLAVGKSYYGVHHMAGNAAEWVDDYYDADFYTALLVTNPRQAANQGFGHVIRGGSYRQAPEFGRTANRARLDFFSDPAEVGFRCMRTGP